jgi:hypothetical protein
VRGNVAGRQCGDAACQLRDVWFVVVFWFVVVQWIFGSVVRGILPVFFLFLLLFLLKARSSRADYSGLSFFWAGSGWLVVFWSELLHTRAADAASGFPGIARLSGTVPGCGAHPGAANSRRRQRRHLGHSVVGVPFRPEFVIVGASGGAGTAWAARAAGTAGAAGALVQRPVVIG